MDNNNEFQLTLKECERILAHLSGLVIVDDEGVIRYMSEDLRKTFANIDGEDISRQVIGRNIREIYPASKLIDFLEAENTDEIAIYLGRSSINIARMKALYEGKERVGAIDFDLFSTAEEVDHFFNKLENLTEEGMLDFSDRVNLITSGSTQKLKHMKYSISDIIGTSPSIIELKRNLVRMSESDSTVLIEAETGCGKELVAHSIHNLSTRMKYPLVEINCAAIPETLFESELFGYEEGSFTGARQGGKAGKLELAEKGTLFLDEVDQLPIHIQPKLLRVLQEKEFSRIGGKTKKMDVRIVAASNKNLAALVREGKFREDLYYRLNIMRLTIPPLRERKEDIPLFVEKSIREMNSVLDKKVEGVSPQVMKFFYHYNWPGNVRELKNLIERAMNLCVGKQIEADDLGDFISESLYVDFKDTLLSETNPLEAARELAEREVITKALNLCGGNKQKTAELLKISRATLYNKLAYMKKDV
ncbi:sigma 54-interacting transcriptional regulator [Anaerovorax odorimutans]|uniref:Sigma 54-interacting transcriptional regulator n=1 Tax=Anaerovorax odorimutans TaxID=109327 RepID=A0ABT1RRV9_9FIRM|nr:sigma 54-interacting transcriptional regulator [Anaerovorax odorimutans]MCQ4637884.1 sigma 54-interacting transcriptional regulator [Anaerovorax odorimutans]